MACLGNHHDLREYRPGRPSAGIRKPSKTIKTIRFDDCNFTGNIPESYANIPARQGTATTQLWLKGNKLSGVVPAAVQAHENWQPKAAWKYETNILPQQEGFGLTLE